MSTNTAIHVDEVSKLFRIGSRPTYNRISEVLTGLGRSLISSSSEKLSEEFWALQDVSFDVYEGEVLGIIGRNGAGKSTLLKILSRVMQPTKGRFGVRGRLGALLEVGTGFHPELTGRENIFLSGTILGMRRDEIRRHFDEIVEFAGIDTFLDTPVKRYSSGMFVRLGFAIAAHLQPETLIVDEVLAVGDAAFQNKCLGKMRDVAESGRTVLFVSHNLGAVRQLCGRCLVLEQGSVSFVGNSGDAVEHYLSSVEVCSRGRSAQFADEPGKVVCLQSVEVVSRSKNGSQPFDVGDTLELVIEYVVRESVHGACVGVRIDREAIPVFASWDTDESPSLNEDRSPGQYRARIPLPQRLLKAGRYSVSVSAGRSKIGPIDSHDDAISFEIEELAEDFTHFSYGRNRSGSIIMPLKWQQERTADVTSGESQ